MSNITTILDIQDTYKLYKYISSSYPSIDNIVKNSVTNEIQLNFTDILTDTQKNNVMTFLDTYTDSNVFIPRKQQVIQSTINSYTSLSYFSSNIFIYPGYKFSDYLREINIVSKLVPSSIDDYLLPDFYYNVKIIDITNNIILATNTYNNKLTEKKTINIDTTLLSEQESIIEIQIKKGLLGVNILISFIELLFY